MIANLSRSLRNALIVTLMVALWTFFAPAQFGGTASYVIVAGASMEPALQQGDLVITRGSPTYQVGDITAYQHPEIGPIIHRIIEREGPYYTLQGDNNDWIDSYEPVDAEILGKAWLHLPGAAQKLLWLRTPLGLTLLSFAIGIMFLISITKGGEEHKKRDPQDQDMLSRWYRQTQSLHLGEWVFPIGIVLFGAIILGAFAYSRPELEPVPVDIPYTQKGSFAYAAVGSPSVYDQGQVNSGEAVFHALVEELELQFAYSFETNSAAELSGSYSVFLRISESSGWQRTIELQPETTFQGKTFNTNTSLDLKQITGIVERMRARTGLNRQVFEVDVYVPVNVSGTLNGLHLEEAFTATLPYKLDEIELYVDRQNPLAENGDPLQPEMSAYLPNEQMVLSSINLLGLSLPVRQARQIALIAGGISLALIVLIMVPALAVSMRSETERIKLVHADRLLDVNAVPFEADLEWIELNSIADLIRLAESSGKLIFHMYEGEDHTYVLIDGETGYRLVIHDPNGTQQPEKKDTAGPLGMER